MKYLLSLSFLLSYSTNVVLSQIAPSLTVPKGHKDVVRNCYFTPNDNYLISTDDDHVLCIWDGDDGRQIFTLRDSLGSFTKIEVDNRTSVVAALAGFGQLYIINFQQLKVIAKIDSVADFSINKSIGTVFFIRQNQFSASLNKFDPVSATIHKTNIKNFQKVIKIIALSETSIALQDELKGVVIASTLTGKIQPVADRLSIYLTLYDYHPSGFLLCGWKGNADFTIYSIDAKSNTIKAKILLSKQTRNLDCAYTPNAKTIIITKLEDTDDMGSVLIDGPALYSFNTGKELRKLGSEYVSDIRQMNLNFSRRSVVTTTSPDYQHRFFIRHNFSPDTVWGVFDKNINQEANLKFACANKSKKIALFNKDLLFPVIYPNGVVSYDNPGGTKKYNDLSFDISNSADKKKGTRINFLFSNEVVINDTVRLVTTDTAEANNSLYTGIIYHQTGNTVTNSFRFLYHQLLKPSFDSKNLYWSVDSTFYVLDLSLLKLSDSISLKGGKIEGLSKAGNDILLERGFTYSGYGYKYNISQKKITDTANFYPGGILRPYMGDNYSRHMSGISPGDAEVNDYDYINGMVWKYPFITDRVDTVAVYESTGEISSYQAVRKEPSLRYESLDIYNDRYNSISDKIENQSVLQVRYWDDSCYIIMTKQNNLFVYSLKKDIIIKKIYCPTISELWTLRSSLFIQDHNKYVIVSFKDRNDCFIVDAAAGKIITHLKGYYNPLIRQPADLLVLEDASFGNFYVYSNKTYQFVSLVTPFSKTDYVINTSSGLFDGTEKAIQNLYFLINDATDKVKPWKTIDLNQLKAKYYIPGLWDKLISGDSTDLPDVESIKNLSLAPEIITDTAYSITKPYKITLIDKGGGIGAVRILVNGKEVIADARENKSPAAKKISLSVDLSPYKDYFSGPNNYIQVFSSNADSSLVSRGTITTSSAKAEKTTNPRLFVISIGTSNYKGTEIDLLYSSKDAMDMASALKTGARNLFGADSTFIYPLVSNASDSAMLPSKKNIDRTFKEVSKSAEAKDIVVLYLSGHGINAGGDFCYLTKDAYTANSSAYLFKEVLQAVTISSREFTDYFKKITARKQLFIIDACASGKVVENLIAHRDIPYSTLKALDRLKDRTGTHIITGCAADAVSYEASRYGQGLLTYSLLEGMKGASLRENKFLDVVQWFQYARERVPQLADGLGGIQTPQVYSPSGNQSFDIALLDDEAKKQIPLAAEKPVFIKSIFQEEEKFADHLQLGRTMDMMLSEKSAGNTKNRFIFFPVDEFPGARQVLGRYKATGEGIAGIIKIFKTGQSSPIASFSITAPDVKSLSIAVLEKIQELE